MDTALRMTANDVLAAHWDGQLPVRPELLAAHMGIDVFYNNEMPESGCIFLDERGQPRIEINPREPLVRKRFTVAHELGHLVAGDLSHGQTMWRDTRESFSSINHHPREVAANRFAAELLMPAEHVRAAVRNGMTSLATLAQAFGVSEVAMRYRLINLGMLRG